MKKGAETRARIIDAAINLINRKGFKDTSIQDIIDATGVKKGNLYFHFPSKDELGCSLIREAGERYFQYLSESIKSSDPRGKIADILAAVLEHNRGRGFIGGCIFGNTALEMSDTGEQYAAIIREIFTRWERILAHLLRESKAQGDLPAGIKPEPMARYIIAAMEGSIMMARLHKREEPIVECIGFLKNMLGIR
ncbi:MAG: hypothetical protein A2176_08590 [Spirochaetes bacterium RBG_13_51_14]|nr:MAG: hypothetical protein A2176_08590 [Spirochaetes bacterium RBG_13_51_14]